MEEGKKVIVHMELHLFPQSPGCDQCVESRYRVGGEIGRFFLMVSLLVLGYARVVANVHRSNGKVAMPFLRSSTMQQKAAAFGVSKWLV